MTIDLDALEALARKATAGSWAVQPDDVTGGIYVVAGGWPFGENICENLHDDNARFIAACDPQTILELIERARCR